MIIYDHIHSEKDKVSTRRCKSQSFSKLAATRSDPQTYGSKADLAASGPPCAPRQVSNKQSKQASFFSPIACPDNHRVISLASSILCLRQDGTSDSVTPKAQPKWCHRPIKSLVIDTNKLRRMAGLTAKLHNNFHFDISTLHVCTLIGRAGENN
ncbi:hypothetical protein PoB_001997000 [Plakobranchus ocellatus]|uniref:Uncharacterized protein n=1 Tax=Plakobranchus ocellatus TaxID=259542 RepID=A0AAV3ZE93_9GAST|nr:hypothetical protein PoB_001997000 [Plakobranchus ocellatus]